jgi:hypothetical protein
VNDQVVSIRQFNFITDTDATPTLVFVAKTGRAATVSGDNGVWSNSVSHRESRAGLRLDLRLKKPPAGVQRSAFYVTDQYDTALPFFAVPLGPPRYHNTTWTWKIKK